MALPARHRREPAHLRPGRPRDALIDRSRRLAARFDASWTMHLSDHPSDPREPDAVRTTARLHGEGLLDERLLACHCIGLEESDISLLHEVGARATTRPVANGYLAMGDTPLPMLLHPELAMGVGTDDLNCNESANLLADLEHLALLTRSRAADPSALTPERILEMATIEGARAVGMASSIGSLETGKLADVILVDRRHAQMAPGAHLPTTLVFGAHGHEVSTVIINGEVVMRDRHLRFLDRASEHALCRDASRRAAAIHAGAGLTADCPWPVRPPGPSPRP